MNILPQLLVLILCAQVSLASLAAAFDSELYRFEAEQIADGLVHPWSMAFLPEGGMLVTERDGKLLRIDEHGHKQVVSGLFRIREHGQGGLLDVALHPAYQQNKTIYLSYVSKASVGYGTEVIRAVLDGHALKNLEMIFKVVPKKKTSRHFGSRFLFDRDNILFISLGDGADRLRAQDLGDHAGSLIRVHADGAVPKDNPFIGVNNALPEIYTYGNRNIQGLAMHPETGEIYAHEHGPQGGDELNLMKPGKNYGWPVITYGVNYVIGTSIGEGTAKAGLEQPLHYWAPSIAPSGMTFYTGNDFPEWQGDLFIGSLKFGQLVRLELKDNKVIHEERTLAGKLGRIRDVRQGPDGKLYLLTDEGNGKLFRLKRLGDEDGVSAH